MQGANVTNYQIDGGASSFSGEGVLSIDSDGLSSASSSYTAAASSYDSAIKTITNQLKNALNVWDDASKGTWEAKVNDALTRMQTVGARMSSNASVLTEIARAATETESNVKSGIESL